MAPKGGKARSTMSWIQIADPAKHTLLECGVRSKRCTARPYRDAAEAVYKPSPERSGALRDNAGVFTHESLGEDQVAGVATLGMRDTSTLNVGVAGNDRVFAIVREFWYSPKLGFNVLSSLSDGRHGVQRFKVTELTQNEPEGSLFEMPKGYTMTE